MLVTDFAGRVHTQRMISGEKLSFLPRTLTFLPKTFDNESPAGSYRRGFRLANASKIKSFGDEGDGCGKGEKDLSRATDGGPKGRSR